MIRTIKVKDVETQILARDHAMAHTYCKGHGIELGAAAHSDFKLPGSINVAPFSDDPTDDEYHDFILNRDHSVDLCGSYSVVDLRGEAHSIPVPNASQDYVISSHVIEHVPDPISAFLEWKRVIRPGGTVLMVFPKRDAAPADLGRPLTPYSEFLEDHYLRHTYRTHPREPGHGFRGHYHVFNLGTMIELITGCNAHFGLGWDILDMEQTDTRVGNGHTIALRSGRAVHKTRFLRMDGGGSRIRGLIGRAARAIGLRRPGPGI